MGSSALAGNDSPSASATSRPIRSPSAHPVTVVAA